MKSDPTTLGQDYRLLAAECEARASQTADPLEAAEWLRAARSWLFIAEEVATSPSRPASALN